MPDQKELTEEDLKNMSTEEIAELQKQNCIFCKIVSKDIPAKILHEDSEIICILDINPASEGHILVYPKKHYMILPHIPEEMLAKLFNTVKLMSNTLLTTLQCKGTSVFVANGMAAGQKAPHVLIHVFPRREDDGLLEMPKHEISEEQASKIISTIKPYAAQLLGGKTIAQADSKTKKIKAQEEKISQEEINEEIEKEEKILERTKTHNPKSSSIEKKEDKKTEKKVPEKAVKAKGVDLNDIARLFGG